MMRRFALGLAAGATGATALNAITYLDVLLRAREDSTTPADTVEKLAAQVGVEVPGNEVERGRRLAALGALSGIAVGAGIGGVYGLLTTKRHQPPVWLGSIVAAAAAMAAADLPSAKLGVTNPAEWTKTDWASDVIPHLAYGYLTCWTLAAADR